MIYKNLLLKTVFISTVFISTQSNSSSYLFDENVEPDQKTKKFLSAAAELAKTPQTSEFFNYKTSYYAMDYREKHHADGLMQALNGKHNIVLAYATAIKCGAKTFESLKTDRFFTHISKTVHRGATPEIQEFFVHKQTGVTIRHKKNHSEFSVSIYDYTTTEMLKTFATGAGAWPFEGYTPQDCLGFELAKVSLFFENDKFFGTLLPKTPAETFATPTSLLTKAKVTPADINSDTVYRVTDLLMRKTHHEIRKPETKTPKPETNTKKNPTNENKPNLISKKPTLSEQEPSSRIVGKKRPTLENQSNPDSKRPLTREQEAPAKKMKCLTNIAHN